jgi:hypothetical protein
VKKKLLPRPCSTRVHSVAMSNLTRSPLPAVHHLARPSTYTRVAFYFVLSFYMYTQSRSESTIARRQRSCKIGAPFSNGPEGTPARSGHRSAMVLRRRPRSRKVPVRRDVAVRDLVAWALAKATAARERVIVDYADEGRCSASNITVSCSAKLA